MLGSSDEEEGEGEVENSFEEGGQWVTDDESEVIGTRQKNRKVAATGKPSPPTSHTSNVDKKLLGEVGKMTEHIGSISRSLFDIEGPSQSVSREELRKTVQEEVRDSLRPTNEMLKEMSEMIRSLSKRDKS